MQTHQPIGGEVRHPGRDRGAPVTALGAEPVVAQHLPHQLEEQVGDLHHTEPALSRSEREHVAGKRRCDHGERIGGVLAERLGVGEHRYQLVELVDRAGPSVNEEQGQRIGPLPLLVDEVEVDVTDGDGEVVEPIETGLFCPPVVLGPPIGNQVLHVGDAGPCAPRFHGRLIRPSSVVQFLVQLVEDCTVDIHLEPGNGHADGG